MKRINNVHTNLTNKVVDSKAVILDVIYDAFNIDLSMREARSFQAFLSNLLDNSSNISVEEAYINFSK